VLQKQIQFLHSYDIYSLLYQQKEKMQPKFIEVTTFQSLLKQNPKTLLSSMYRNEKKGLK